MISDASRRKPKALQVCQGELNKENISPVILKPPRSAPLQKSHQSPSTPQNDTPRIPLKHLIAQQDLDSRDDHTYQEEVHWKQSTPRPCQHTPGKKRKRAQSSSPPSGGNKFFKTPKPDPASEVWSRYNANLDESVLRQSQSGLENLLIDSSPRSSETASSVGGLRRYNSCGVQFPSSKKKPRKKQPIIPNSYDHPRSSISTTTNGVSKVALLLEEVSKINAPENKKRKLSTAHVEVDSMLEELRKTEDKSPLQHKSDHVIKTLEEVSKPINLSISDSVSIYDDDLDLEDLDLDDDQLPNSDIKSMTAPQRIQKHRPNSRPVLASDDFEDSLDADEWDALAASIAPSANNKNHTASQQNQNQNKTPTSERPSISPVPNDDDEYEDIDFDDVDLEDALRQINPDTQNSRISTQKSSIQRYRIKLIEESQYHDENKRLQKQKVLTLEVEQTKVKKTVILRQAWYITQCTIDSFVHITGAFDSRNICVIDNTNNMLILHPDHLVSATVVADSFGCIRRAVLQDRVKATSQSSPPMLYGNLLHEIFQQALSQNRWDSSFLQDLLSKTLPRHFETVVEIGINLNQIKEYLTPRLQEMAQWAKIFVRSNPHEQGNVDNRNGEKAQICVNKLLDIEEHVWSPTYGLKGNIDATVQVVVRESNRTRTLTVPFEVKTGKRVSEAHQAQTALYTLLVSDRYDIDVSDGVLYYLETSKTMRIKALRHELIYMIIKRNELACYIRERLQLPPLLPTSQQRLCGNCYAKTTCHLYHKLSESGDSSKIDQKDDYMSLVAPLKPIHQDFFKKWDSLITKEESEMMKFRRELWTMLSHEREKLNRCFSHVVIDPDSTFEQTSLNKVNRYRYSFVKHKIQPGFTFTESQIIVGEPIVISDELGHFALANGYVTHLNKDRITVAVDRRLQNVRSKKKGFDPITNQSFTGIMEVNASASQIHSVSSTESVVFRIDKDEFSNGMSLVRNNIIQLMDKSVFKASDLRNLIIEGREPVFETSSSGWSLQTQSIDSMNEDQVKAVDKVLSAKDYALVLGMPGTGKTTTIAHIIRCLVAKGKTVLLTSYTHTAVDNILLKIKDTGFEILRLGVRSKIHPLVQEFAVLASEPKESIEELQDAWQKPMVVATTCLGVNHPVFSQRTFDYCIVDEASQITLPVCLGPIRLAKSFILVGDHFQLPPLVQNKEAIEGGLDMSLFRMLSERHPDAVVSLEHQYRMNESIMSISNALIYSNRLKCGNSIVASRSLTLPNTETTIQLFHSLYKSGAHSSDICLSQPQSCFIAKLLNPSNSVLFFNTDSLGNIAYDKAIGNRMTSVFEADLTELIASALLSAGIRPAELGIVTFYRSQLTLLRHTLLLRNEPAIETHTADKFQGRDKEAVVVSFVRNNQNGNVGDLLRDWRRVNVAVTRARSKLILIGSEKTLANGGDVLKGLVEMCRENSWTIDLKPGDVESHRQKDCDISRSLSTGGKNILSPRKNKKQNNSQNSYNDSILQPSKTIKANRNLVEGKGAMIRDIMNDIL